LLVTDDASDDASLLVTDDTSLLCARVFRAERDLGEVALPHADTSSCGGPRGELEDAHRDRNGLRDDRGEVIDFLFFFDDDGDDGLDAAVASTVMVAAVASLRCVEFFDLCLAL
jgi:hypothetical protein